MMRREGLPLLAALVGCGGAEDWQAVVADPAQDPDWDARFARALVAAFDDDGNGRLGGSGEAAAVDCTVFEALGDRLGAPPADLLGVHTEAAWRGHRFGLDGGWRVAFADRLRSCGFEVGEVAPPGRTTAPAADPVPRPDMAGDAPGAPGPDAAPDPRADDGPLARAIAARPEAPGKAAWDDAVTALLLAAADHDGSGALDAPAEIDAVGCEAWTAMDRGVRAGWGGSPLYVVYGFGAGFVWVGDALGVDEGVRDHVASVLEACGLGVGRVLPAADDAPAAAPLADEEGLGAAIRSLPDPASAAWDEAVETRLLQRHDVDGSGALDTPAELAAIPCDVWRAVDEGVRATYDVSVYATYGFDPSLIWLGDEIGVAESQRAFAGEVLQSCLDDPSARVPAASPPRPDPDPDGEERAPMPLSPADRDLLGRIAAVDAAPASEAWDLVVGDLLRATYDTDRNRVLDEASEVAAIPCAVWRALDDASRQGWDGPLRRVYGFDPGASWEAGVLGFSDRVREDGHRAIVACGL